MIIAAFAGVGKTYFCNHVKDTKDFVCMPYKYFLPEINNGCMEEEKIKTEKDE